MITTDPDKSGKNVEERTITDQNRNATFTTGNPNNFIALCDGITFGAEDGTPFGNFNITFTTAQRFDWAKRNAMFFRSLAERLERYADLLSRQIEAQPMPRVKSKKKKAK